MEILPHDKPKVPAPADSRMPQSFKGPFTSPWLTPNYTELNYRVAREKMEHMHNLRLVFFNRGFDYVDLQRFVFY